MVIFDWRIKRSVSMKSRYLSTVVVVVAVVILK